jgi:hypothetical protein
MLKDLQIIKELQNKFGFENVKYVYSLKITLK